MQIFAGRHQNTAIAVTSWALLHPVNFLDEIEERINTDRG